MNVCKTPPRLTLSPYVCGPGEQGKLLFAVQEPSASDVVIMTGDPSRITRTSVLASVPTPCQLSLTLPPPIDGLSHASKPRLIMFEVASWSRP